MYDALGSAPAKPWRSSILATGARGVEDGDDGHGVADLGALDHVKHVVEGEGADLDELRGVVIIGDGVQSVRAVEVARLVHNALGGDERAQRCEMARRVPRFLAQLAPGRR